MNMLKDNGIIEPNGIECAKEETNMHTTLAVIGADVPGGSEWRRCCCHHRMARFPGYSINAS